jgi:hypothetical protein
LNYGANDFRNSLPAPDFKYFSLVYHFFIFPGIPACRSPAAKAYGDGTQAGNLYLKFRKLLFYPRLAGVSRAGIELRSLPSTSSGGQQK